MGVTVNRLDAAIGAGLIGVAVAVWRLLISRRNLKSASLSEEAAQRLQWELEGNAALSGLMWAVGTVGIYPYLTGTIATTSGQHPSPRW